MVAHFVAGEGDEFLAGEVGDPKVVAPKERMMTSAEKRIPLTQKYAAVDPLR